MLFILTIAPVGPFLSRPREWPTRIALFLVTTIDIVRLKNHTFAISINWVDEQESPSSSFMWLLLLSSSCLVLMVAFGVSGCQQAFKYFESIQCTREVNMMTIRRTKY